MGHEDVEVAKCSSSVRCLPLSRHSARRPSHPSEQAMDSPYDYSRHLQRIEDCKKIGDAQSLRSAREAMLAVFPLSEGATKSYDVEIPLTLGRSMGGMDARRACRRDFICAQKVHLPAAQTRRWGLLMYV